MPGGTRRTAARTLDRLRRDGASGEATAHFPTLSRPGYVALLTGVEPRWSGVRNNRFHREVALDSSMKRLRAAGLSSAAVADATTSFVELFPGQLDEVQYAPWPGGMFQGTRLALARGFPFVVLIPGAVDLAGHEDGADSPEYRLAVASVAAELGPALAARDLARETVIVTADHGHTDSGGHGGTELESLTVPLVLAGAGIRPGRGPPGARLVDVAPTVAALLGVPPPGHGMGRTLLPVLDVDADTASAIRTADEERIARNLTVLAGWRRSARTDLLTARLTRMAIVGALAAAGALLLAGTRRIGLVHLDRRVLLMAIPAFPVVFYGLLTPFGQRFSLSAVPAEEDVVLWVLRFGVAALVAHLLATGIVLHGRVRPRDRLAAANAVTLCGLLLAFVPAGLVWAWLQHDPETYLPGSTVQLLTPSLYVALACYGVAAAVAQGVEMVVFLARSMDPRLRLRRLERAAERERHALQENDS